ncbi:MAG: S9 family peptidase [Candidatus Didemnitutus sp.]|nr:S9 family peptidase [Candidatus Didemnitutus sp.]
MKTPRVVALFVTVVLAVAAVAADKRPITPQDLWAIKRLGSPALSPDGKTVVFTQQEWSIEKNKPTSNLWAVDVASGAVRRLTTAAAGDGSPVWSPDGTRIAFTSKRGDDEAASLYVIPFGGGEAEKVLELPGSVSNPKWMPDGRGVVVATTVIPELVGKLGKDDLAAMKKELKRRKDSKMTAKVTENRVYRYFDHYLVDSAATHLVLVDVATKTIQDLTPKVDRLFSSSGEVHFDIAPDGKTIALDFNSTPPPYRDFPNQDIYLVPTDGSGAMQNITPENKGGDESPKWAPDGKSVYFVRTETPYYSGEFQKLWRHDLASGKNVSVTDALDYSIDEVEFSADGRTLWFAAEDKGVVPIFKANADGSGLTAVYRAGTSSSVRVDGGTVVFLNDTTSRPNELFVLDAATGQTRQLTHVNDAFMAQLDLGKVESYTFAGAGGLEIQGWLVFPPGYDAAKKYPLVQLMHGGPHTMCRDSWSYRWNTHVFAAPGYVVTWVNRHGSTGFGEEFSRSILNQWGDMPFEDIMRSTDYLLDRFKNLDPQRLAAAGASYGGYMAAWVLGHTDRFKAIIDHAGVNSSYAQYATDVPHGFPEVMGGKPWDNVEGLQRENPMFYAKNFKTPTLVLHGEMDYRVPYGNGLELYGVLQAMGVPSRLVVFPDENHWVLKPQNAIYWHWEMQSWLSRYIGGKPALEKPDFDAEKKADDKKDAAAFAPKA